MPTKAWGTLPRKCPSLGQAGPYLQQVQGDRQALQLLQQVHSALLEEEILPEGFHAQWTIPPPPAHRMGQDNRLSLQVT